MSGEQTGWFHASGHSGICWQISLLSCVTRYSVSAVGVKLSKGFGVKRELEGTVHKSINTTNSGPSDSSWCVPEEESEIEKEVDAPPSKVGHGARDM